MTAVTLSPSPSSTHKSVVVVGWWSMGHVRVCVVTFIRLYVTGKPYTTQVSGVVLLFRNRLVDACRACNEHEPFLKPACSRACVCVVSCRPISTGQLHESLVLASTSCLSTQWSSWGPLTPNGVWKSYLEAGFPLRCFQRLSHPNVANQRCTWQYN